MCIDAYMKTLLLKIMEASEEQQKDVWHNGRFLEKWAGEDTLACFPIVLRKTMVLHILKRLRGMRHCRLRSICQMLNEPWKAPHYYLAQKAKV